MTQQQPQNVRIHVEETKTANSVKTDYEGFVKLSERDVERIAEAVAAKILHRRRADDGDSGYGPV